jgi:large subunit ribosomal protein L32
MTKPLVATCDKCGGPRLPHRVCLQCGTYRGTTVLEVAKQEDEE